MTIQAKFSKLENNFYQVKDTDNKQLIETLIVELQEFIARYRNVLEIPEQVTLAQAFELQLVLYLLTDQKEKAEAIEQILDDEFCGIHRIGKRLGEQTNLFDSTTNLLNISPNLLDMDKLKVLAIKQKGTTKPKLLGWVLKTVGFVFIGLAAWLFTKNWLWVPLIIGILGVLFSTIGTQVSSVVNRFLTTIAFNTGIIIPGIITQLNEKGYEAIFVAPLMTNKDQPARWGLRKVTFKKAAGTFKMGERLAGVCALNQPANGYHSDFMPMPIFLGYRNQLIPYKAKLMINDEQWQRLTSLLATYQATLQDDLLALNEKLKPLN